MLNLVFFCYVAPVIRERNRLGNCRTHRRPRPTFASPSTLAASCRRFHPRSWPLLFLFVRTLLCSLRTMGVWLNNQEDRDSREAMYRRGVVYYIRDDKVCTYV